MLVKLSELLYKLYSNDQPNVVEALRIVRVLDAITLEQISETILNGKPTQRPVFFNPTAKVNAMVADEDHLKLIASHVKRKTNLVNSLRFITKIGDTQLDKLAQLLREEKEAVIVDPMTPRVLANEVKPFMPLVNWSQQKDLASGGTR